MFLLKEKMNLNQLIYGVGIEVMRIPKFTYEDYLKSSIDRTITSNEYSEFILDITNLKLSLLMMKIFDSSSKKGFDKYNTRDISIQFVKSIFEVLIHFGYEEDESLLVLEKMRNTTEGFFDTLMTDNYGGHNVMIDNFCIYYFKQRFGLGLSPEKAGDLSALINGMKKIISEYYDNVLKKIKLI